MVSSDLPTKEEIMQKISREVKSDELPQWSRQELASLIFNVYYMGEGDWKSICVEDPHGPPHEKKTAE